MNTKTKLLISGFIALSLVLSIVALNRKGEIVVQKIPSDSSNKSLGLSSVGNNIVAQPLCVNGICEYNYHLNFAQATTSPCQIVSPAFQTQLVPNSMRMVVTGASTTAYVLTMATSTSGSTATTTLIARHNHVASKWRGSVTATTTTTSMTREWVIATSTTINFSIEGGQGGWSIPGYCEATLRTL